jgi:FAD dependent oxidoreductase
VDVHDGRIERISLASRYGNVSVAAAGFVDASGDAALTWAAGLPCWVPERPIYGSQQVIVENVDERHKPDPAEMDARIAARGGDYGLLRRGGLAFYFPGRGTAVLNVTHVEAPLDPVRASQAQLAGKVQADGAIALLRAEFPGRGPLYRRGRRCPVERARHGPVRRDGRRRRARAGPRGRRQHARRRPGPAAAAAGA